MRNPKNKIFSTWVSSGSFQEFTEHVLSLPEQKHSSYVCFANVHMLMECYKSNDICAAVNKADLVAPDGKPLSVFMKVFHRIKQDKVSGPDVFPSLLKQASTRNKRIFFYGSTNRVLQKLVTRARTDFPGLQIVGTYSPPFRELSPGQKASIVDMINRAAPHFVFVALGCPKQESWMAEHHGKINACMLGLGQAFQVYAGELKRAPKMIQDLGFEWAYRLACEPGRLWRRYLVTNSLFLFLSIQYGLKTVLQKHLLKADAGDSLFGPEQS